MNYEIIESIKHPKRVHVFWFFVILTTITTINIIANSPFEKYTYWEGYCRDIVIEFKNATDNFDCNGGKESCYYYTFDFYPSYNLFNLNPNRLVYTNINYIADTNNYFNIEPYYTEVTCFTNATEDFIEWYPEDVIINSELHKKEDASINFAKTVSYLALGTSVTFLACSIVYMTFANPPKQPINENINPGTQFVDCETNNDNNNDNNSSNASSEDEIEYINVNDIPIAEIATA